MRKRNKEEKKKILEELRLDLKREKMTS